MPEHTKVGRDGIVQMLAAAVDAGKGLLVDKALEAVAVSNSLQSILHIQTVFNSKADGAQQCDCTIKSMLWSAAMGDFS